MKNLPYTNQPNQAAVDFLSMRGFDLVEQKPDGSTVFQLKKRTRLARIRKMPRFWRSMWKLNADLPWPNQIEVLWDQTRVALL